MIKAVINVDAPSQHVFNILTDFAHYKDWIPGCEKCSVNSQTGTVTDADIVVSGAKRIEMTLRFEAQPPQVLSFRMTKAKDIKAYSGTYRLMQAADGKGTVVIAELEIDAGFMVPKFMVDKISSKMMDDMGSALRKHAVATQGSAMIAGTHAPQAADQTKTRRPKRILSVTKTPEGYRIWLMGESFTVQS